MEMRGLTMFISDIRNCRSKDQELKRISKELAKIRSKFKNSTSMSGYDRKKYISKLLYVHMLGHDIDFGHMEAVRLLSSDKYSEKHMGYLACTLLLDENHELLTLITNTIALDLASKNEYFQCLALTAIANVGGKDFAEALTREVQNVLVDQDSKTVVVKKAALTLLRLFRKYREVLQPDEWSTRIIKLLDRTDLGIVTSVASLLVGLVSHFPEAYQECVPRVVRSLAKIVLHREFTSDYAYYGIPAPWLQVKLLRILQYYPPPEGNAALLNRITEVLNRILHGSDTQKNPNKNNAVHAVLFEAINLTIRYNLRKDMIRQSVTILGKHLQPVVADTAANASSSNANMRYLSFEAMARLAVNAESEAVEQLRRHQKVIVDSLRDADISIRRRSLEVLYCLCDHTNAHEIVDELLSYLQTADFGIREELVLRIALLAENFATNFKWYIDVVMKLIHVAGDFVSDEVWFRVVQIVSNDPGLQAYAAENALKEVRRAGSHEVALKLAGYLLGEFGDQIADRPGLSSSVQFEALYSKFHTSTHADQALLMTAFSKILSAQEPGSRLASRIQKAMRSFLENTDAELQQRSFEYLEIFDRNLGAVLAEMPPFVERESSVLRRIRDRQQDTTDVSVWKTAKGREDTEKAVEEVEGDTHEETAGPAAPAAPPHTPSRSQDDALLDLSTPEPSRRAPAAAAATTAPASSDDTLLDMLSGPAPVPAAPAQPTPTGGAGTLDDIFGAPVLSSPAPAVGNNTGVSQQAIDSWLAAFRTQLVGVLFEDVRLQIGVKSEFRGSRGRLALFFGNKAPAAMTGVQVAVAPSPALAAQCAAAPAMIASRTQGQVGIEVTCNDVFDDPPAVSVSYESGGQMYHVDLKLPVFVTKFMEPTPVSTADDFFSKWRPIPQANEKQEVFKSSRPIDLAAVERVLTQGVRVFCAKTVDPNPANFVGVGAIATASAHIVILVRIETNAQAQAYRVTVRSTTATASASVCAVIKGALI